MASRKRRHYRPHSVIRLGGVGSLTPALFDKLSERRRDLWALDPATPGETALAAALALVVRGQLCCQNPVGALRRVRFLDLCLESDGLWIILQPDAFDRPYPIFLSLDESILVLRLAVETRPLATSPADRPFALAGLEAGNLLERIERLAGLPASSVSQRHVVAANRVALHTAGYPTSVMAYMAGELGSLSLRVDGPPDRPQVRHAVHGPFERVRHSLEQQLYAGRHDGRLTHGRAPDKLASWILDQANEFILDRGARHGVQTADGLVAALMDLPLTPQEYNIGFALATGIVLADQPMAVHTALSYLRAVDQAFMAAGDQLLWSGAGWDAIRGPSGGPIRTAFRQLAAAVGPPPKARRPPRTTSTVRYLSYELVTLERLLEDVERLGLSRLACAGLQAQIWVHTRLRDSEAGGLVLKEILPQFRTVMLSDSKNNKPGARFLASTDSAVFNRMCNVLLENRVSLGMLPLSALDPDCPGPSLTAFLSGYGMTPHDLRDFEPSRRYLEDPWSLIESAQLLDHSGPLTTLRSYVVVHHLAHQKVVRALYGDQVNLPRMYLRRITASRGMLTRILPDLTSLRRLPRAVFRDSLSVFE